MPGPDWTAKQRDLLIGFVRAGMTPSQILATGRFPGRTRNAILKAKQRYGCAAGRHSEATKAGIKRRKAADPILPDLDEYLRCEGLKRSASAVAKRFDLTPEFVKRRRHRLGLTPEAVLSLPSVRKTLSASAKRRAKKRQKAESKTRKALAAEVDGRTPDEWKVACIDCNNRFPFDDRFFTTLKNSRTGKHYLSRRCIGCSQTRNAAKWEKYKGKRKKKV